MQRFFDIVGSDLGTCDDFVLLTEKQPWWGYEDEIEPGIRKIIIYEDTGGAPE